MLRITEIFYSLQGETSRVGLPTTFVRLTGCPLRCGYCDTSYAFSGGELMNIDVVINQVALFSPHYVTVTGGEPLAQAGALPLLEKLCDHGYSVSLETSGALDISQVDKRVSRIVDIKTPGSGEVKKNNWKNLECLTARDELKFVLCHENDYHWAKKIMRDHNLDQICPILFSPVFQQLDPAKLAAWILQDKLPVRLQLQLHKLIWGECAGK
ncbi:MAG: 7-carboxy-7-deazaguanine synthase QueE [Nitrosomonas sp.]|nr:7-carboxy-7-deazaguanine synthase QueE [Nitrosomonas sp.]